MNDTKKRYVHVESILDIMNDKASFDDTLQIYEEEEVSNKKITYKKL